MRVLIDTAAVYGLGHSETVVGRAIKDLRERPYVFTKVPNLWRILLCRSGVP